MLQYQPLRQNILLHLIKFTKEIPDAKVKEKELVDISNICNPVKNFDLNTNFAV